MKEHDQVHKLIAEINGVCGPHIVAGINGKLPLGWYSGDLSAMRMPGSEPLRVVVFASAGMVDRPLWACPTIGARLEVDSANADHLTIADGIAQQLSERIQRYQRQAALEATSIRIALSGGAVAPERASAGASGYDVRAIESYTVAHGEIAKIRTGLHFEIPAGMEAQVRPRSGLATRGLWVHLGTIESDYRGECCVVAVNVGDQPFRIEAGDRIAQLVFQRVAFPEFDVVEVTEISPSQRGDGGLGSTGTR